MNEARAREGQLLLGYVFLIIHTKMMAFNLFGGRISPKRRRRGMKRGDRGEGTNNVYLKCDNKKAQRAHNNDNDDE